MPTARIARRLGLATPSVPAAPLGALVAATAPTAPNGARGRRTRKSQAGAWPALALTRRSETSAPNSPTCSAPCLEHALCTCAYTPRDTRTSGDQRRGTWTSWCPRCCASLGLVACKCGRCRRRRCVVSAMLAAARSTSAASRSGSSRRLLLVLHPRTDGFAASYDGVE